MAIEGLDDVGIASLAGDGQQIPFFNRIDHFFVQRQLHFFTSDNRFSEIALEYSTRGWAGRGNGRLCLYEV